MKRSKLLLIALAVLMSAAVYGNSPARFIDVNAISYEIENILKNSFNDVEEGFKVTVFFSISEENKIQQLQVASPNQELNKIIIKELENQETTGPSWRLGKIYELSVVTRNDHYITSLE